VDRGAVLDTTLPLRRAAELRRRTPEASGSSTTVETLLIGETASSSENPRVLIGEMGFVEDRSRPDCDLSLLAPDYRETEVLGVDFT